MLVGFKPTSHPRLYTPPLFFVRKSKYGQKIPGQRNVKVWGTCHAGTVLAMARTCGRIGVGGRQLRRLCCPSLVRGLGSFCSSSLTLVHSSTSPSWRDFCTRMVPSNRRRAWWESRRRARLDGRRRGGLNGRRWTRLKCCRRGKLNGLGWPRLDSHR